MVFYHNGPLGQGKESDPYGLSLNTWDYLGPCKGTQPRFTNKFWNLIPHRLFSFLDFLDFFGFTSRSDKKPEADLLQALQHFLRHFLGNRKWVPKSPSESGSLLLCLFWFASLMSTLCFISLISCCCPHS